MYTYDDDERHAMWDKLEEQAKEIAQLKGDLKAMTSFADLWYFVMDEQPMAFEKIVCEYTPAQWMHQAHLLKQRTKK